MKDANRNEKRNRKPRRESPPVEAGSPQPLRPELRDDFDKLVRELESQSKELRLAEEQLETARCRYADLYDFAPVSYVTLNERLAIAEINLTGASMLEAPRSYLIGRPFEAFLGANSRHVFANRMTPCLRDGEAIEFESDLITASGSLVSVLIRAVPQEPVGDRARCFVVLTDITTQRRTMEAAQAASEAKSRFLANMSHEIRTPMNAILGMIDVALPRVTDPVVLDCLQTAKGSADLLLTLLNDLLDSAKIESGKLELESAPFRPRDVLEHATQILAGKANEKRLVLHYRMLEGLPKFVLGDRVRLEQILLNLVGNAIKFTHQGNVEIVLRALSPKDGPNLEFAVHDTGIGIPSERLGQIFDPFAQADTSMTRRFGGTGLGLSICRRLVEKMGGAIWVVSQPNEGSTFAFTVRMPPTTPPASDTLTPAASETACGPLRILLAEDTPANQKLASYILKGRGHQVEIANNGREAVSLARRNHYDTILMDVQMPELNGLDATAEIRRFENCRRVPIIAMTAHAMQGDRDQCLAAGMDAYLSKPIHAPELIEVVERLAGAARDK